ncbi:MAG: hypothetical protein CMB45_06040 [Euryarchaeota archaeon]|nr:hypothetical protein [Euryarchaeota archaeon]
MAERALEAYLAWHEEAKAELKNAKERKQALEKQILELAKEKGMSGAVRFDYAGMYFEASINIDRTRTKNPTKSEVIEQFRKMLPEGEQTVENAREVYDSLTSQASQTDSVTSKEVNPPKEVLDAKREEFEKELNAGQ